MFIDGVSRGVIDLYSPTLQGRRIVFPADNLTPGQHTIAIKTLGTKHTSSSGFRAAKG